MSSILVTRLYKDDIAIVRGYFLRYARFHAPSVTSQVEILASMQFDSTELPHLVNQLRWVKSTVTTLNNLIVCSLICKECSRRIGLTETQFVLMEINANVSAILDDLSL